MKKLLPIAACLILGASSLSYAQQTPEAFKYQASLRNAQGEIIADKLVSIRVVILSGNKSVYSEVHTISTNQLGLVNFEIGRGTQQLGAFKNISWDASKHFVRIEMDEQGGNNFKELGTSELLSVPYSLHATMASDVMPGSITIQNEIAARQSADKDLQSQINIVRGMLEQGAKGGNSENTLGIPQDLEALRNRFMADSVAVRGLITSGNNTASSAVATEKSRAEGVEAGLRTDVDAAIATNNSQATAITANETAIAAETARALAAEAALDAKIGTTGGTGVRRMTRAQRDSLSAQGGELIYNTTENKFQGYELKRNDDIVDQSLTYNYGGWGTNRAGQSFTVGSTGFLSKVGLGIYYSNGGSATLKIYSGNGVDAANEIYSQPVNLQNYNGYYSNNMQDFELTEPIEVTAGEQYTFEIIANNYFELYYSYYNQYSGGDMYHYGSQYWYYDFNFRTYIAAPSTMQWVNLGN